MTRGRAPRRAFAFLLTFVALAALSRPTPPAEACGGFFRSGASKERLPSLAYEQVLILHDPQKGIEHFIRQVAFHAGGEVFGFVVPVPGKPEVVKLDGNPFDALLQTFRFDSIGLGDIGTLGGGRNTGISVLSTSKVGSFTAFVVRATDAKALAKWLSDNGLESTAEADAWLSHYVRLGFYYVAMRYDPKERAPESAADAGAPATPPIKAETIRISFPTPAPFYPYFEPEAPPGAPPAGPRMVDLLVATTMEVVPVATLSKGDSEKWVRPFAPGYVYEEEDWPWVRTKLSAVLGVDGARLLPEEKIVVSTFVDQKVRRTGFGDIVFVPKHPSQTSQKKRERLKSLLGILDPALVPEAPK